MRRALSLLAAAGLLAAAAAAGAAVPAHDGAWVSDESRSFWSDGKFPKGFKLTIEMRFAENKLVYHSVNTTNPDKPYVSDHTTTLDGKPAPFPNQARFDQVSVLVTGPDDLQILKMKGDDVIAGEFWSFAPDGKTAVRRGVGKNPEGHSHAYQETFVKR